MEEREEMQPVLKSNKFYKFKMVTKRIVAGVLVFVMVLGACAGLVGCVNNNQNDTDTNSGIYDTDTDIDTDIDTEVDTDTGLGGDTDTDIDSGLGSDEVDPPIVDDNTTDNEFFAQYGSAANQFALDMIEQISYGAGALSTTYQYVTNENGVEQIKVAMIVESGETERKLQIATIDFANPVDFDDIVAGETNAVPIITTETALTFDAKEEYMKGDSSTISQQIAEKIEENLGESSVEVDTYETESFAPTSVADLVADYSDRVNEVLNTKCKQAVVENCFFMGFEEQNIVNAKWILEGENEVTGAKMLIDYKSGGAYQKIIVADIDFAQPISAEDFINLKNIKISNTLLEYGFDYKPSLQGTRDDLVNAIFAANGMSETCPEGAIRLIKDNGYQLDTEIGETNEFIVVQIDKDEIIQYCIRIKKASSDVDYIAHLNSVEKYKKVEIQHKEIDIEGEEVEYVSTTPAATATSAKTATKKKYIILENGQKILY